MGTFPAITIDVDSTNTVTGRNLQNDFGDGYSQVIPDGVNAIDETWDMSFKNRPKADVYSIRSFLLAGPINGEAFDWQSPVDGVSKKWRMKAPAKWVISDGENQTLSIKFSIERYYPS